MEIQLRIPGPTPCPPEVLKAVGQQMINHRGAEFDKLINDLTPKLKQVYQTKNDVFVMTGSGTGAIEAAIVNVLSPGDRVLSCGNGVFADRFAEMAETFGASVNRLKFEWGKTVDPDEVRKALQADPAVKAVLVTHNETSTGVTCDLKAVAAVAKEFDKLVLVDGISSVSMLDVRTDEWGLDVVLSGSQKGWMVPPGLCLVSVSEKAWQAHAKSKMPKYYWDFAKAKKYLEIGQTPWTPAVSIFFGLAVSVDMIMKEGVQNVFARHVKIGEKIRKGVKGLGFTIFADEKYASNTVTSVNVPEGLDEVKMRKILRDKYKLVLSGGQSKLSGKMFRIGHMGYIAEKDADIIINLLAKGLAEVK
jgi:aspartate aminotransferase-like enzyme